MQRFWSVISRRATVVVLMIAGMLLAGCDVQTDPQDVDHFSTNRAPTLEAAAYTGLFQLYGDNKDNIIGPLLMSRRLNQGEMVGFEVDQNRIPFAIAGKDRLQLSPGRYRWQMTPDAGQTDWGKTNVVIIEVVVGVVVGVIAVVSVVAAKSAL